MTYFKEKEMRESILTTGYKSYQMRETTNTDCKMTLIWLKCLQLLKRKTCFSSIRSKTPNRILRRRNKCLSIRERFLMGKSLNLREIFKKLKTEQKLQRQRKTNSQSKTKTLKRKQLDLKCFTSSKKLNIFIKVFLNQEQEIIETFYS